MVEVGRFEADAHHRAEGRRRLRAGHALPKPVAYGHVAEAYAHVVEVRGVHRHVPKLLAGDGPEAAAKREGRLGPRQDGPGHQLGGLKLVVQEGVHEPRARPRIAQGPGAWALLSAGEHRKPVAARGGDAYGDEVGVDRVGYGAEGVFGAQRAMEDVPRPGFERARCGGRDGHGGGPMQRPF